MRPTTLVCNNSYVTTISFVVLGVRDLKKAVDFYCRLFDLDRPDDVEEYVTLDTGSTRLGFYAWDALAEDAGMLPKGEGFRGVALAHNVGSKEEVDAVWKRAVTEGASGVKAPEDAFWGGYSGYFADRDGHLWEVAWNPHME